jgi:hypothetical protein
MDTACLLSRLKTHPPNHLEQGRPTREIQSGMLLGPFRLFSFFQHTCQRLSIVLTSMPPHLHSDQNVLDDVVGNQTWSNDNTKSNTGTAFASHQLVQWCSFFHEASCHIDIPSVFPDLRGNVSFANGVPDGHEIVVPAPVPREEKPSHTSERLDTALEVSSFVLATLKDAATLSSVPFLREAAGLALGILDSVQVGACSLAALTHPTGCTLASER